MILACSCLTFSEVINPPVCPQLPSVAPSSLANGAINGTPPSGWSCDADKYYELDGVNPANANCDCDCGVIDPDCGFVLPSCSDQQWLPKYKDLVCNGVVSPRDQLYCRLDSATCQALPPGLQSNRTDWTCIPDVYNELSDPGTSLNDCDCNCGGLDPDCMGNFDNIYCSDEVDSSGNPVPIIWGHGVECGVTNHIVSCQRADQGNAYVAPVCPQLPPSSPAQISTLEGVSYSFGNPPPAWTCAVSLYYEVSNGSMTASCDCGCGVIDPDCGYSLVSCDDQTWNPRYSTLHCDGNQVDTDILYCRLESATCQVLPPGLQRGSTSEWTCIPDVYSELSDPGTSLNDCDCNCGGMDPDCFLPFNDIYCPGVYTDDGVPVALPDPAVCNAAWSLSTPSAFCHRRQTPSSWTAPTCRI